MPSCFVRALLLIVTVAAGCGSSTTPLKTTDDVSAFTFRAADNPALSADVAGTICGSNITATVPIGTDVTALVATFTTDGASVRIDGVDQTSGTTANDFTSPVDYEVLAQDGATSNYIVTVTVPPGSAKDITAYAFLAADNAGLAADVTATITGTNITASVPFGTDVTALVATFATTGQNVAVGGTTQVSGTTPNDFTNPVTYEVTAGDTTTQDYTVTITIGPSPAKDITAFAFLAADNAGLAADVTATITGTNITATVPFGTDVTALVATFATTGASVAVGATTQVSGTTPNDFTSAVTYVVTAADASTQDYTVTITIAQNPAKDITSFAFLMAHNAELPSDVTATISGTSITATLPSGATDSALVATFVTTGASVSVGTKTQVSSVTVNNFTNPVTYTVTAADTTTQDYTVVVTVPPGD